RGVLVTSTLPDRVFANGPYRIHALVEYFRARLQEGSVREGAESATFEHVKVPGKPGQELSIVLALAPIGGVNVVVRDTPPPTAPALPDEEARWRATGLTKQGRVIDPTHLE